MHELGTDYSSAELISVIIPTYNRSKLLKRSVNSVLAQTYSHLELIVVDDGSNDDTISMLQGIDDSRITILQQDHQGACAARNEGIEFSHGALIAFQDSDDIWDSQKLQKQYLNMHSSNSKIDFCRMVQDGTNKTVPNFDPVMDQYLFQKLLGGNFFSTQTTLICKESLGKIRFDPQMPRLQDWDFFLRLLQGGIPASFTKENLVTQFDGDDRLTRNNEVGHVAYKMIEEKYQIYYNEFPKMHGQMLYQCAKSCQGTIPRAQLSNMYLQSLRQWHNPRAFIRYCLSLVV